VKLIPKQLWKEDFLYSSDQTIDELKTDIENVLSKKWWQMDINLTGSFFAPYAFRMTPKWQLAVFSNGGSTAYLNGEMITHENQTLVRFTVRPNSTFTLFFFIAPLLMIIVMINSGKILTDQNGLVAEGIFLVGVPVIMYFACVISKSALKNRFVQTFKLKELP
jgi:hypothetical protein